MGISKDRNEERHIVELGFDKSQARWPIVTLEVTIRKGPTDVAPYLDWNLNPISEYTEVHFGFSVGEESWHRDYKEVSGLFPHIAEELRTIGQICSKSETGTVSGTEEQMRFIELNRDSITKEATYPVSWYDVACSKLKDAGLYESGEWRGPGNDWEEPKPYRFGHAWLIAGLSDEDEQAILDAMNRIREKI